MIPLSYYLILTMGLYIIGMYCLATKRNVVRLVLGIEIMINAANLNFIVLSANWTEGFIDPLAHSIVMMSITLAGCISAAAFTIIIFVYRHYGTLDIRELRRLRG
jgi:NADH:ubiquinone oxidoreductase subunit K